MWYNIGIFAGGESENQNAAEVSNKAKVESVFIGNLRHNHHNVIRFSEEV